MKQWKLLIVSVVSSNSNTAFAQNIESFDSKEDADEAAECINSIPLTLTMPARATKMYKEQLNES